MTRCNTLRNGFRLLSQIYLRVVTFHVIGSLAGIGPRSGCGTDGTRRGRDDAPHDLRRTSQLQPDGP